ncbi:hypothetical protein ZWY2020_001693 [Hordeum vulgare]|nr:hypothetical protein ZWY2020_001693 [Hordeum vulgare]
MERQDLGAWLGLATGGGAVWHPHDGERRPDPVRLDALFPRHGKEERDQDEQKTGGKGARRKMKVAYDDGRSSSSNGPCLSDGGGSDSGGGRRKKLRLTKEQCALLEGSFRAHNILSHVKKQELARQLKLSSRQVEVWFQNRRARTKLKQTEVDCEFLRRWCESLTDENQRLKHQLLELQRSTAAAGSKLFAQLPRAAAMVNLCPSCEKVAVKN